MNKNKKQLLDKTYQTFMDVGLGQNNLELLDDIVAKDVVGFGTAIDEKIFGSEALLELLKRQKDQSAGMDLSWKINILDTHISADENTAIFTNDVTFYITIETDTIEMYIRFSVVLEFAQNKWIVVHWHGSKPELVESEKDTWGIETWKEKAEALEKEVAERTADLVEKNRELKIEAALERVRSRSMAMHKTEELQEVVRVVAEELKNTGVILDTWGAVICTYFQDSKDVLHWTATEDAANPSIAFLLPYFKDELFDEAWASKNRGDSYFAKVFSFDVKNAFFNHAFAHSDYRQLPDDYKKVILESNSHAIAWAWSKNSAIMIPSIQGDLPSEEEKEILIRFATVFEQSFIRFLDLQNAETQAREVQIELSLERIRSQVTAMRESSDLLDIVVTMRTEFVALGLEAHYFWHMRWLPEKYEKAMTSGDGTRIGMVMTLPRHIHGDIPSVADWEQRNEPTHVLAMDAETAVEYVHKMITLGDFELVDPQAPTLDDIRHIGGLTFVMARTTHGEIGFSLPGTVPDPPENSVETLVRFASVFDLAYKRFEDLKTKERQHREVQIELTLERVRAKAMAMQSSTELPEAANLLFQQVQSLGMPAWSTGYCTWDDDKNGVTLWMSSEGVMQPPFHAPLTEDPLFIHIREAYERGETFHVDAMGGEALIKHYRYMRTLPIVGEILDSIIEAGYPLPTFQIMHCAYFSHGFLLFITYEPVPEAHSIFQRFAKVFDQTYTRFLDLQKAEVQAREARIEAALEKVRARALAMQIPDELKEVAQLLREEMGALGVEELETSSIYIHNEDSVTTQCWFTIKNTDDPGRTVTDQMTMDLQDTWVGRKMLEFYRSSAKQTSILMQGENRVEWIRYCEEKSALFTTSGFYGETIPERTYHLYKFSNGFLGAASPGDISTASWDLLKRATNVFSFAYTRFHDLQVAEASAWGAMRQASLDKVRAEIASMRSTQDLQRITPLIWQQLTHLQVSFIRCGVFIMDDAAQIVHTYLSTADGKDLAVIHLPYSGIAITEQAVAHWRKQAVYIDHWDKAAFHQWTKQLIDQGHIVSTDNYQAGSAPDHLHLHFVPFTQGMLYVGSVNPLPDESIDLIHSLAGAFATAYARYEDFNRLEVAKKKTDLALTDLEAAKDQLVQQEKLASLGQLTAGIAHEIKNPLNFVNNFSDLSKELLDEMLEELVLGNTENVKTLSQDIKANLTKIHEHGSRADSIVKSMLLHSRGGSGQKELTDLNLIIKEYVNLTFHGMRASKLPINVQIDLQLDETTGPVPVIAEDISRVIINLCNNAFDAMRDKLTDPSRNNGYTPKLIVHTKRVANHALIEIADNGPGIPEDIKEKILQPFFTTKKGTQGTGLGLSITHDIIKAHGGELIIETKEGLGTTFHITLPAKL